MQYIKHDFIKNWENAIKYKDYHLVNDILNDELAKLIVFDKPSVVQALADSGIAIKNKDSDKQIVKSVLSNIDKNEHFRKSIVSLIIKNNIADKKDLVSANSHFSGGGKYKINNSEQKKLEKKVEKWFNGLNANIYLNFDSKDTQEDEKVIYDKVQQHMDNKNSIDKIATKPVPVKKLAYIYLGLAAVGIISLWYFNRKFVRKYGGGGEIESGVENTGDFQTLEQSPQAHPNGFATNVNTQHWTPPVQNPAPPISNNMAQPEIPLQQ